MSVSLSKHPAPTACPAPGGPHSGPAEETGTRTVAAITTAFPLSGIAHTAPDAVAGVVVSVAPDGTGWERLSAAFTDEAPILAESDDLTVVIAPGAGQGAPACLLPAHARIEIDGTHLGVDPATADPARPGDRYRYPTAWGLFVHECAHDRHTAWNHTPDTPPAAAPCRAAAGRVPHRSSAYPPPPRRSALATRRRHRPHPRRPHPARARPGDHTRPDTRPDNRHRGRTGGSPQPARSAHPCTACGPGRPHHARRRPDRTVYSPGDAHRRPGRAEGCA